VHEVQVEVFESQIVEGRVDCFLYLGRVVAGAC